MRQVTELHLHDGYSTMDGTGTPEEYMQRAKELGMTHMAQTNHGTTAGFRHFQRAAKDVGISPIMGLEAYITNDRFDKTSKGKREEGDSVYNHITLLAQGDAGAKTLFKLNEVAYTDGFYSKPRIDIDTLAEYNDGIIALSGCLNGMVAKAFEIGDIDKAIGYARRFKEILGDRFYFELQGHNPAELNQFLLDTGDRHGIQSVVTSDCHYVRKEDLWLQESMLILSTSPKKNFDADASRATKMDFLEKYNYLYPDRKMTFEKIEIFLHSLQDHEKAFQAQGIFRTDIFENTNVIAQRCEEPTYYKDLELLPVPKTGDVDAILERKVWAGLKKKGLDKVKEYVDRVNHELDIIKRKKFSTYFLIVEDIVSWSRSQGIWVGPGRGSGAGSIVNWLLDITRLDPIKRKLLFSRFIDESREDWPDIDLDFQKSRRGEVKDYVRKKFKHVAGIATLGYFADKGVFRDAARVLDVPLSEVNRMLKQINTFEDYAKSEGTKEFRNRYPQVTKLATTLRGRIRQRGQHAAAIVISNQPLINHFPIETAKDTQTGERVPMVAFDMNECAEAGLQKLDLLGVKVGDVIVDTLKAIEQNGKKVPHLEVMLEQLDDLGDLYPDVFKMLSDGYTSGVFQCEAGPFTNLLIKMKAKTFDDIVVGNALVRPGAWNVFGEQYLHRRDGKETVEAVHPDIDEYLSNTYSLPVYQEQSMQLVAYLADMGMGVANKVRKITAKKQDKTLLAKFRDEFIAGATPKVGREKAEFWWNSIEETAEYQFNLSHSEAYSVVSFWTAFLKCYYPLEFMYGTLKNEKGDTKESKDSRTEYLIEAKRLGVKVYMPHVNESEVTLKIEPDALRLGLSDIKFISEKTAPTIVEAQPFGSYKEFVDLVNTPKNGLNVRVLNAVNAIGAASFDDNPRRGDERENYYEYLGVPVLSHSGLPPKITTQFVKAEEYIEGDCVIMSGIVRGIKRGPGWARVELLQADGVTTFFADEQTPIVQGKSYLMLIGDKRLIRYIPMEDVKPGSNDALIQWLKIEAPACDDGEVYIVAFTSRKTKKGARMASVVYGLRDKELQSCTVWPSDYHSALGGCKPGTIVKLDTRLDDKGARFYKGVRP